MYNVWSVAGIPICLLRQRARFSGYSPTHLGAKFNSDKDKNGISNEVLEASISDSFLSLDLASLNRPFI